MTTNTELMNRQDAQVAKKTSNPVFAPRVDIYENDDEILLYADMPGVVKEDITINIDNGRLTLGGSRTISSEGSVQWEEFGAVDFERAFSVPQTIAVDKVHAELNDGVLKLHLPKSEAAKPRQIEIKTK